MSRPIDYIKRLHRGSLKKQLFVVLLSSLLTISFIIVFLKFTNLTPILTKFLNQPPEFLSSGYLNPFLLSTTVIAILFYAYIDYRQHLNPLKKEMPTIIYTPGHYARVVLVPKVRYSWKRYTGYLSRLSATSFIVLLFMVYGINLFIMAAPGDLAVTINQKQGTPNPNPSYISVFEVVFSQPIDSSTFTVDDIALSGSASGLQVQSLIESGSFNGTTYDLRIEASGPGTIIASIDQELVNSLNDIENTNQASTGSNVITYDGSWLSDELILRVKTDEEGNSNDNEFLIIANLAGPYNYNVDCENDGVLDFVNQSENTVCSYDLPGEYDIAITGEFPMTQIGETLDAKKLLDIKQWGSINWTSMESMFKGASNLNISAIDSPRLDNVQSMSQMFSKATQFNSSINHWDISNVTNISYMFSEATNFNQPLNNWDVSNVTTIRDTFSESSFNQPLNNWDVSNVTNMFGAFYQATDFNQPLNNWDVSNVTSLGAIFYGATSFNQSLGSWNIENVTSIGLSLSGISIANYDSTLIQWSEQNLMNNVFMDAVGIGYCESEFQRQYIIDQYSWTISDYGKGPCQLPVLSVANSGANWVSIEWTNPDEVDRYDLEYKNITSDTWIGINNISFNSYYIGSLPVGSYEFRVRSTEWTGYSYIYSNWSELLVIELGNITTPQNLTAIASISSVDLDWDDVVNVSYYVYQYKKSLEVDWEFGTDFVYGSYITVSNLDSDTSYDFRVMAVGDSGNVSSDWSEILTISTNSMTTYSITNCRELQAIVIDPVTYELGDPTGDYIIENDIDCSETYNWDWAGMVPPEWGVVGFIGITDLSSDNGFNGNLNGQGYEISNIYQSDVEVAQKGLISFANGSTLRNIIVKDININSSIAVPIGGLVSNGENININNSSVTGSINMQASNTGFNNAPISVGGLTGFIDDSTINKSFTDIEINMEIDQNFEDNNLPLGVITGGLAGIFFGEVNNSYSRGNINLDGGSHQIITSAGGLIGQFGAISPANNLYSEVNIEIINSDGPIVTSGGLAGFFFGALYNSFSTGQITSPNALMTSPGGLIGGLFEYDDESIEVGIYNSYFDVNSSGQSECIGGYYNKNFETISQPEYVNCYPINIDGLYQNYFINNSINPPLDQWNFNSIWKVNIDSKPTFLDDDQIGLEPPNIISAISFATGIEIDWNDVLGADRYIVEFKKSSSLDWTEFNNSNDIEGSFLLISNLDIDTEYNFRVKAVSEQLGESNWSAVYNASTTNKQIVSISDCTELQSIIINPYTFEAGDTTAHYILTNDIDCSESYDWSWEGILDPVIAEQIGSPVGFIPIMDIFSGDIEFTGSFDGDGYTISNINQIPFTIIGGIFGVVGNSLIENVNIENINIRGPVVPLFAGGLVGDAREVVVSNVHVNNLNIDMNNTSSDSNMSGSSYGGIIGSSGMTNGMRSNPLDNPAGNVKVLGSSAKGAIYTKNASSLGGIIGSSGSIGITVVTDPGSSLVVSRSFSDVDMVLEATDKPQISSYSGGIVGSAVNININNSYSRGSSSVDTTLISDESFASSSGFVGWLIGGTIRNSYSSTEMTVRGADIAISSGLIGSSYHTNSSIDNMGTAIYDSFATGPIELENNAEQWIGGILGVMVTENQEAILNLNNSFYDQTGIQTNNCIGTSLNIDDEDEDVVFGPPPDFSCNKINQNIYFKNNNINTPLDKWNFNSIWQTNVNDYPTFRYNSSENQLTVPSAPRNLSFVDITNDSLTANWLSPLSDGGSEILGYQVQYRPAGQSNWISASTQNANNRTHTLSGLPSSASYELRVSAFNSLGSGPYSNPIFGTTLSSPFNSVPPNQPSTINPNSPSTFINSVQPNLPFSNDNGNFINNILRNTSRDDNGSQKAKFIPTLSAIALIFSIWLILLALAILHSFVAYFDYRKHKSLKLSSKRFKIALDSNLKFIRIISHYLRTPIEKMQASVDLELSLVDKSSISESTLKEVLNKVKAASIKAEEMILKADSIGGSQRIITSNINKLNVSDIVRQPLFWLPVIIIFILTAILHIVFTTNDIYDATLPSIAISSLIIAIIIILFGGSLFYRHQMRNIKELSIKQNLLEQEVENNKQSFIDTAAVSLSKIAESIDSTYKTKLTSMIKSTIFLNGLNELNNMIDKFDEYSVLSRNVPGILWSTELSQVLASSIVVSQKLADQKNVEIISSAIPTTKLNIQDTKLKYIIDSILKNSINAAPKDSIVTLNISNKGVSESLVKSKIKNNKYIEIDFSDKGPGIPSSVIDKIGDPFSVISEEKLNSGEGLYLELSLVNNILEQSGGTLSIDSTDSGSKLTIRLAVT